MFKIKDILNDDRGKYSYFIFLITLIIFGTYLIINSVINISLFKNNFNNQKITKLTPRLNVHEDFFMFENNFSNKKTKKLAPGFIVSEDSSINFIPDKNNGRNNQSANQSINLNNFVLETLVLSKDIPALDLRELPNKFYLTKNIKTKKEKFIILILPVIVKENEKIRTNRKKLLKIKDFLIVNKTLHKNDQQFLEQLASRYNINTLNKHKIDTIDTLLESVDVIPNSIVLAQAANESGWGTSRFAKEYNALFGEYTFDINNGVVPTYRDDKEKYLIKFFSTINESIGSYFNNLNTHPAYKDFRAQRKQLRKNKLELDPIILVKHLKLYAKDKNYVQTIESIIKTNKLTYFDSLKIITTKS